MRGPIIRSWTADDDARLLDLIRQGVTSIAIAVRLRRSVAAIYARKTALKLRNASKFVVRSEMSRPLPPG